jgi:hypothetical protein
LLASVNSSSPNIDNIYNDGYLADVYTIDSADSAVDCCVECQVAIDCESFAYYEDGTCYLFNRPSGSCSATDSTASQSGGGGFYTYENGSPELYVVGNGACGYLYDGGVGAP